MKKPPILMTLALLTVTFAPAKALADEVWSTEQYNVTYQEDRDRPAIWTYGPAETTLGTIFIDGLAGVYTDRGSYNGYWVQETSSLRCDTYREDANGDHAYYWGRFDITFIDPEFPSRWKADFGLCDQEPTLTLTGTPVSPLFESPTESPTDQPTGK
jgi:hypothetical protein